MAVEVLDCTLRDGGYINNWEFGRHAIPSILKKLDQGGIDIIECGFLTGQSRGEDTTLFQSPEELVPLLPHREGGAMFVAMIALGEWELSPDRLPPRCPGGISGIRLTFHREEAEKAFSWAAALMDKGYQVFLQPVGTAFYSDLELLRLVEQVDRLHPFAFYIVDTLGSMLPNQVTRQFHLIDENLDSGVKVGFHGHNNLQLAYANAQTLVELGSSRPLLIDASIQGMGRGAGNLNTELFLEHLNDNAGGRYQVKPLLRAIDRVVDVFPGERQRQIRLQLSMTLRAVVSQRLLPKQDGTGRALACEVMVVTPAIANLIREGKTPQIQSSMSTSASQGSVTMDSALIRLRRAGLITQEDAFRCAQDVDYVRRGIAGGR